jgi:hypothetical protein
MKTLTVIMILLFLSFILKNNNPSHLLDGGILSLINEYFKFSYDLTWSIIDMLFKVLGIDTFMNNFFDSIKHFLFN